MRQRMAVVALGVLSLSLTTSLSAIDRERDPQAAPADAIHRGLEPDAAGDAREPDRDRDRDQPNRLILPGPQHRWTLGVEVDNLDTGVRITRVYPGTAAWRIGLETRESIVTVGGYQVGRVGRRIYDLGTELNLRADRSGRVGLLVWNHRNGELVNLQANLDRDRGPTPRPRDRGGFQGEVTFRTTIQTERPAEVVVQLVDITERQRRPVVQEQRIPFTGELPVRFHLDSDPEKLDPRRRYALQAQLEVEGRRVLVSRPGVYELTRIDPDRVQIELEPIRFDRR